MATMQDPENVEYRIEFANYLKENGKIILALRECEQARLIAPHNPKVEQLLHSLKKVAL